MCVITEFTIIIGYLQTFHLTIIADFSRKWPTIYDNHKAPVIVYFAKGEPRNVEYGKVFCGNAIYGCSGLGHCRMLNFVSIAFCVIDLISMLIR